MEPSELDRLIRQKQQEAKGLYQRERDSARAKVWSSVHSQIEKKKSLRWYHLAAAVVLILIPMAIVFNSMQQSGEKNLENLTEQIDQLKKDYLQQAALIIEKDAKLASLQVELLKVETQLKALEEIERSAQSERIVYVKDTVYIKQVEYITTITEPVPIDESLSTEISEQTEMASAQMAPSESRDDIIFLSHQRKKDSQRSESLKLQIGSLTSRN